jgi:hypothetical protein
MLTTPHNTIRNIILLTSPSGLISSKELIKARPPTHLYAIGTFQKCVNSGGLINCKGNSETISRDCTNNFSSPTTPSKTLVQVQLGIYKYKI